MTHTESSTSTIISSAEPPYTTSGSRVDASMDTGTPTGSRVPEPKTLMSYSPSSSPRTTQRALAELPPGMSGRSTTVACGSAVGASARPGGSESATERFSMVKAGPVRFCTIISISKNSFKNRASPGSTM